jgi:hypothetical protein
MIRYALELNYVRMLENAGRLCAEAGFAIRTRMFPAEEMPFAVNCFDLVTGRVAPHHFSSPGKIVWWWPILTLLAAKS